jgi:short-chain fatty acids transporter
LKKLTNFFVAIVNRWLPDAFLFAVILTIITFVAALIFTDNGPIAMLNYWGNSKGFWGLLAFSMQMAMVVVLGTAFANAPVCKKILKTISGLAHDNKSAILTVTFISTICCWLNWGFGLVAGALLAKEIARRVPTVDYRLLIASAYSGLVIWHAGLSGSIPLTITSETTIADITFTVPLSLTIFHPVNLIMCAAILVIMPFLNYSMHPDKEHAVCVDPTMLKEDVERTYTVKTPADRLEHSKILWIITLVLGFGYLVYYFATSGFNLTINIVNMIFMFLGILAHGDLRRYVDAIGSAASTAAGILLQFPFYAGIMGMMVGVDPNGQSLAGVIANAFVSISNNVTFPMLTFLSAGIINFFVPSGGGQWAVQAPIVIPAAKMMGIEYGRACMGIAWGDQWTNMIQPFWALPALGIAGLQARDIMGFLVIVTIFVGIVACIGFLLWAILF